MPLLAMLSAAIGDQLPAQIGAPENMNNVMQRMEDAPLSSGHEELPLPKLEANPGSEVNDLRELLSLEPIPGNEMDDLRGLLPLEPIPINEMDQLRNMVPLESIPGNEMDDLRNMLPLEPLPGEKIPPIKEHVKILNKKIETDRTTLRKKDRVYKKSVRDKLNEVYRDQALGKNEEFDVENQRNPEFEENRAKQRLEMLLKMETRSFLREIESLFRRGDINGDKAIKDLENIVSDLEILTDEIQADEDMQRLGAMGEELKTENVIETTKNFLNQAKMMAERLQAKLEQGREKVPDNSPRAEKLDRNIEIVGKYKEMFEVLLSRFP